MYCFKCGRKNPDDSRFCEYCGAGLTEKTQKKKERQHREKVIMMIAMAAMLVVLAVLAALFFAGGQDKTVSTDKKTDTGEYVDEANKSGPWDFFIKENMISKSYSDIEKKYGMLSMRNEGENIPWQDSTDFDPSFYFIDAETPVFSIEEESQICNGMAGTAEQVFGIKKTCDISDIERSISPETGFELEYTTDVKLNGWYCIKNSDGRNLSIHIYPDSLEKVGYKDGYDWLSQDVPAVTPDNFSEIIEGYTSDPTRISPDTNVVIYDMESPYYEEKTDIIYD